MKIVKSIVLKDLVKENPLHAQGIFPALIRMLIRKSVNKRGYSHIPVGDSIYTTGWDGLLANISTPCRFVPEGNSVWEMGTNKDGITKIRNDYKKEKAMME